METSVIVVWCICTCHLQNWNDLSWPSPACFTLRCDFTIKATPPPFLPVLFEVSIWYGTLFKTVYCNHVVSGSFLLSHVSVSIHISTSWCINWPYNTNSLFLIECALSRLNLKFNFKSLILCLVSIFIWIKFELFTSSGINPSLCVWHLSHFPLFFLFYLDVLFPILLQTDLSINLYLGSLPTFLAIL